MRLTPPTNFTFLLSAVILLAGLIVPAIDASLPVSLTWFSVAAYIVLMLGVLIRGI